MDMELPLLASIKQLPYMYVLFTFFIQKVVLMVYPKLTHDIGILKNFQPRCGIFLAKICTSYQFNRHVFLAGFPSRIL